MTPALATLDRQPRTLESYFADWESHVFGFGYGTGEPHTIPALRHFLNHCRNNGSTSYDFAEVEHDLGPAVTWMMINILCHADIIEYGTSPRFGWLTSEGKRLKAFVAGKTDEELIGLACPDETEFGCSPGSCNCGPHGYEEGRICQNPFWAHR